MAGVPEVGGGLSADGDSFVLLIVSFQDLLHLGSLQQGHTGGQLSVAVIWRTETDRIKSTTETRAAEPGNVRLIIVNNSVNPNYEKRRCVTQKLNKCHFIILLNINV